MQPPSPGPTDTDEPRGNRGFAWSLGALVLGSGAALAMGWAPLWIERSAAGFLWFVVVAFLALMAAMAWQAHVRPLPENLRHLREAGQPQSSIFGDWTGYLSYRLVLLLLVVLLIVAGRPVLAGCYVIVFPASTAFAVSSNRWIFGFTRSQVSPFDWAIYQAFRMVFLAVKWSLWVIPLFAAQVRMLQAGVRLDGRLVGSLGLSRKLAYLLYAPGFRPYWRDLPPNAFWLLSAVLALCLATAALPPVAEPPVYDALWFGAVLAAAVSILACLVAFWSGDGAGVKPCPERKSAYRLVAGYLRLVLQAAVLGAFWSVGMLWLAALYLVAMIASIAATEACARLLARP